MRTIFGALIGAAAVLSLSADQPAGRYEVYAVRFAVVPAFPVSGLVAGADRSRALDIPCMVWLLKGTNGRRVLADAGFTVRSFWIGGSRVTSDRPPTRSPRRASRRTKSRT